jgi:hypothetical protein
MESTESPTYVLVARDDILETLALTGRRDDLTGRRRRIHRVTSGEGLPVVEDHGREGLAGSVGTEIGSETERLVNGQVGLASEQRSTRTLDFLEDVTSPAGEDTVDTTHGLLGHLNLDEVVRLDNGGLGKQGRGVEDTTSGRHDLTGTTMDGIGVEGDIHDVETNTTHGLLAKRTLLTGPLETGDDGVLDFVEVLDGLGLVDNEVGAVGIGTETPDLTGISDIPAVLVSEVAGTGLEIVTRVDLAVLNVTVDLLRQRLRDHVDTVVLVGRLGQSGHAGGTLNGLTVGDDGVRDTERNTSVVLLEILQANFQMELTSTGNNVLTALVNHGQNARIRLGQTLETFDQLGEIVGVLDLDGTLDDRRDGELHDLEVVGSLAGGKSTRLEQELVNTNQTQNVTSWHILNRLNVATHHENGTLDGLDEEIILLARDVVGTLDADLETRLDGTGEDTTESVETTLIRSGNHLRDVDHEGTLGVTITDTNGSLVIVGALVQSLHTVLLGNRRGRQMKNHHLQKGVSSGQELPHDDLEERLALEILLVGGKLDLKLLKKGRDLILLEVHNRVEDAENGVQDELVEGTDTTTGGRLRPLLGLGVEEVVTLGVLVNAFML